MDYRAAGPQDAPLLALMNKQLIEDEGHPNPMTVGELEQRMAAWLTGREYDAVLFTQGGDVHGYALFRREPDHVYLRQFFVSRRRRRSGVGRAALGWLKEHAWGGEARVRLDVLVGNQRGVAFWRSMGFRDYCLTMEWDCTGGS